MIRERVISYPFFLMHDFTVTATTSFESAIVRRFLKRDFRTRSSILNATIAEKIESTRDRSHAVIYIGFQSDAGKKRNVETFGIGQGKQENL